MTLSYDKENIQNKVLAAAETYIIIAAELQNVPLNVVEELRGVSPLVGDHWHGAPHPCYH